jgi:catechol 2,3-dioxygenase-like lactoylglutathione lyase family enzyme
VYLDTLDHIGLAVSDVDRSIQWYEKVPSFCSGSRG